MYFITRFVRVLTPAGARPLLPINIKGHGRLRYPIDQIHLPFIILSLLLSLSYFSNPICCSSFISATSKGILGGLPILEQPYVHQLRRSLSRAGIRRSTAEIQQPSLTAPLTRSDRPAQRSYIELLRTPVGQEKAPTDLVTPLGKKILVSKTDLSNSGSMGSRTELDQDNIIDVNDAELSPEDR